MENKNMVPVEQLCTLYDVEISFIHSLQESGLIEVITIKEIQYVNEGQISDIERIMRLYYDLDINIEGIDVVFNLLRRVDELQRELKVVKNRLSLYED